MKTMMTTTTLVIIISLMITTRSGGGTTTDPAGGLSGLVKSTCKNTPNYNLCVQVLSADHRAGSPKADVSTLAIIVVDAVKAESLKAADKIRELRPRRGDLKAALEKCDFEYNKVILGAVLDEAYEALTKGNPKFAEDAMVGTATSAQSCQDAFGGAASPLSSVNARVRDLSVVARAIIRNLL